MKGKQSEGTAKHPMCCDWLVLLLNPASQFNLHSASANTHEWTIGVKNNKKSTTRFDSTTLSGHIQTGNAFMSTFFPQFGDICNWWSENDLTREQLNISYLTWKMCLKIKEINIQINRKASSLQNAAYPDIQNLICGVLFTQWLQQSAPSASPCCWRCFFQRPP